MPTVISHDTPIYYEVFGASEPTLIFAHGMGGNAASWYNQVAAFSHNHRVITFDHRYFARSSCPEAAFNPAWFTDDVIAIMDACDVERAIFICQSMGGWTGSQMAVHHPTRTMGLLMSHTPGVFEHSSAVRDMTQVSQTVSRPFTEIGSPALAADYPEKNRAGAMLYAQISRFNGIDPSVIPRAIGAANLGVNIETLTDYSIPTRFVTADHDILFPPDFIQAIAEHLPGAEFVNLGDAGHSSYFESPERFNETLHSFIQTIS